MLQDLGPILISSLLRDDLKASLATENPVNQKLSQISTVSYL